MKSFSDTLKQNVINNLIDNTLKIVFVDNDEETITEANMSSESMKIKQSICDDSELKFGGCIASEFSIDLINSEDRSFSLSLVGKWISVQLTQTLISEETLLPSSALFPSGDVLPGEHKTAEKVWYLFSGYIDSAERDQNDRNIRHVVAYDLFAKMYDWDATTALMSWLKSETRLGTVLAGCLSKTYNKNMDVPRYGNDIDMIVLSEIISEAERLQLRDFPLINNDWVENNSTITFGEVLRCICEMIGRFGVIIPDASKGALYLRQLGLSPEKYDFYESFYAEEYKSGGYNAFMVLNGNENRDDKIIHIDYPDSGDDEELNYYDLTENTLCWQDWDGTGAGTSSQAKMISLMHSDSGKRMYESEYTPITATLDGRPWVEAGDKIQIVINQTDTEGNYLYAEDGETILTETVESYALSRTLSGIKALTDTIEAKGE